MEFLTSIFFFIQAIIGFNLLFPILMYFLWLLFKKKPKIGLSSSIKEPDYAIIVTAYEQIDNLQYVVSSILKLNYTNYIVYIVADKCDISLLNFEDNRINILRPEKTIASNTGSHLYAINNFIREHDRVTIIDSDNLLEPEYLKELNLSFNKGFKAVQGVRLAKNIDTTFSCLDAARDIYYHFYDGKILFELGSSATLSGSGMAFETQLYKNFLKDYNIKGAGFDKILQFFILSNNERIAFAEKAIVYDEKTSKPDQLVKQRSRWINTWFKYFKFGFILLGKGIKNLSFNQTLFSVVLLRPPLFLFILFGLICLVINLFVYPIMAILWIIGFLVFTIGFFTALLSSETDLKIYKSLKNIPVFMFLQIVSLMKSKNANKHSVATKHVVHNNK
jgi:cellulose synthase/poly-beta-1,6-N-acetylglucosamine synthase-like glycosyltransferase